MQKIKGTYASAVIYSDTAEDYALAQVIFSTAADNVDIYCCLVVCCC